jgi:DNA ligase D-like protein (predicted 3'-phosphoesterase)
MEEIDEEFCSTIVERYKDTKLEHPVYVIQEHHAKRLHWDLRLEIGDVLKSWALPKEPNYKDKRLAIQVDDHPIQYALFEGEIPKGSYGAGLVRIWDIGTFELESLKDKKIVVRINGKRLNGRYCLLRFKENWLFFKIKKDA